MGNTKWVLRGVPPLHCLFTWMAVKNQEISVYESPFHTVVGNWRMRKTDVTVELEVISWNNAVLDLASCVLPVHASPTQITTTGTWTFTSFSPLEANTVYATVMYIYYPPPASPWSTPALLDAKVWLQTFATGLPGYTTETLKPVACCPHTASWDLGLRAPKSPPFGCPPSALFLCHWISFPLSFQSTMCSLENLYNNVFLPVREKTQL